MATGKISSLKENGFGFITVSGAAEGDKDLFFHRNALEGVDFESLNEGDELTFEVEQGQKGPNAVNVTRA